MGIGHVGMGWNGNVKKPFPIISNLCEALIKEEHHVKSSAL